MLISQYIPVDLLHFHPIDYSPDWYMGDVRDMEIDL